MWSNSHRDIVGRTANPPVGGVHRQPRYQRKGILCRFRGQRYGRMLIRARLYQSGHGRSGGSLDVKLGEKKRQVRRATNQRHYKEEARRS